MQILEMACQTNKRQEKHGEYRKRGQIRKGGEGGGRVWWQMRMEV